MDRPLWLLLVSLAASAWSFHRLSRSRGRFQQLRDMAEKQFRSTKVVSEDPRLSLDGSKAEVVLREVVGLDDATFSFTAYARNEAGEYFMFKFSNSGQMVKHVEPRVARVVLKERFVPPGHFGGA